jgi:hypothetical protein
MSSLGTAQLSASGSSSWLSRTGRAVAAGTSPSSTAQTGPPQSGSALLATRGPTSTAAFPSGYYSSFRRHVSSTWCGTPSPGCSRCTFIRCRPAASEAVWRPPCSTTATSGRAGTGSSIGAYLDHFDRSQILVIASEVRPPEPGHAVLVTCYRAGYRDTLAPWRSLNRAAAIWARRALDRGLPPGPRRICGSCGRLPCSSGW